MKSKLEDKTFIFHWSGSTFSFKVGIASGLNYFGIKFSLVRAKKIDQFSLLTIRKQLRLGVKRILDFAQFKFNGWNIQIGMLKKYLFSFCFNQIKTYHWINSRCFFIEAQGFSIVISNFMNEILLKRKKTAFISWDEMRFLIDNDDNSKSF